MYTYKQNEKDASRELLWEHAIFTLTTQRNNIKLLNEQYIIKVWDYIYNCKYTKNNPIFADPDVGVLNQWCDFSHSIYGNKQASELRIIYLCGPEPENDIKVLLKYGVRVENIWAIESDKMSYNQALENAKVNFPMLKIYKGKISEFLRIYPLKFDIIYLDLTKSLIAEYKTINNIFDNQSLSEFGVLIVNSTMPDKDEESIEFLSKFFLDQNHVEGNVLGLKKDDGNTIDWFTDPTSAYGYYEVGHIKEIIDNNFGSAYSSFSSLYPMIYASSISPLHRISKSEILYNKVFQKEDIITKYLSDEYSMILDLCGYSEYGFICRLISDNRIENDWRNYFGSKDGSILSRTNICKLIGIIRNAYFTRETKSYIYNESFYNEIINTYKSMEKIEKDRLFTDILFPNRLLEIYINQIGFVYHPIPKNHKRLSYTAKTREMYIDIFTFDQCRSFYDWLPMIEFYDANVNIIEKQMLIRSFLDAMGKEYTFTPIQTYNGTNVVGFGEKSWANFTGTFSNRININNDNIDTLV